MPKHQRYFLLGIAVALLATLAFLSMERTASSSTAADPASSSGIDAEEVVARSDDGSLIVTLDSPRGLYWFGRQRVSIQVQLPSGDGVKTVDFFVDGGLRKTLSAPPFELEEDFGEEIRSHSLVIFVQTHEGRAARLARLSRPARVDSRVEISLVTMPVAVQGPSGRFLGDLDLTDFSLAEDGIPQTIVHFDRDPTPASVVIALDSSESMQGSFWSVQKAANQFIASLPPYYKVCLIGFSDSPRIAREFTFDRRSLAFAVSGLRPSGDTALYDTLRAAGEELSRRPDRRVAVIFSDGGETLHADDPKGRARLAESLRMARESGVTFYTIAFGPRASTTLLRRIAEETGGAHFDSGNPAALDSIFSDITESLVHQYLLSYYPSRLLSEGGWRSVSVRVRVPGAFVQSRPGYLAGPVPQPAVAAPAPQEPSPPAPVEPPPNPALN